MALTMVFTLPIAPTISCIVSPVCWAKALPAPTRCTLS
jgi:hypothetical protein